MSDNLPLSVPPVHPTLIYKSPLIFSAFITFATAQTTIFLFPQPFLMFLPPHFWHFPARFS